jgi:hypothetical protein
MCQKIIIGLMYTLSVAVLLSASPSLALYSQPASTLGGGGGGGASASYSNLGVIAQPGIVGSSLSASYSADHGFMPVLGGWRILYPVITATPGVITFSLVSGASDVNPLAVANDGGSVLKWSVAKGTPAETYFTVSPSTGTGNATINVTANAAGLGAGTYSDTLIVSGAGISQAVQVQLTLHVSATGYLLTVTVLSDTVGKGGGSVHSDPDGIACSGLGSGPGAMSGVCSAGFYPGTIVTLYQTPDTNSIGPTWTASGCATGENCAVVMSSGPQGVTATFLYVAMAKVNSSGIRYETLAGALANTLVTDTILARDVTFVEPLTIIGKTITLDGGLSGLYLPQNAWTTLQGILTIQSGSLTVDGLVVK